jgi:hypothetical protein
MIRERASSQRADPRQAPSRDRGRPRPTFASRARERAAELAVDLAAQGQALGDGGFFAIDPRDPRDAQVAISDLVREGLSARQAAWALARAVEEATLQNDVVVGISWCDAASLQETVAGQDPDQTWPARLAAPLPTGFMRLVMLSEGRVTLSIVARLER